MTALSRIADRLGHLPPVVVPDVTVTRDIPIVMPDGVTLLADRYHSPSQPTLPTILVRSAYGRRSVWGFLYGRLWAERGFQVLVQSCRGTFGSGGTFRPFETERSDGVATLKWIAEQPWCDGNIGLLGMSYAGYAAWSLSGADTAPPQLKAMVLHSAGHDGQFTVYPGGAFALADWVGFAAKTDGPEADARGIKRQLMRRRRKSGEQFAAAYQGLPLLEGVRKSLGGRRVDWLENWMTHAPGDPYWATVDAVRDVQTTTVPTALTGGWQDLQLLANLAQLQQLRKRGVPVQLTIGPWTHSQFLRGWAMQLTEGVAWFRAFLCDEPAGLRAAPVRTFVQNTSEWREWSEWPPPQMGLVRWVLQPGGRLTAEPVVPTSVDAATEQFRYDPADPTPSRGGATMTGSAGRADTTDLETRPDVLVYTSEPLQRDVELAGPVTAELSVRTDNEHFDVFVRLTQVDPEGVSVLITDGLRRCQLPAGELHQITVELGATGIRLPRGHRLRVVVAGAAHPRFARNLGAGEPLTTGTTVRPTTVQLQLDSTQPCAVVLPVLDLLAR